MKYFDWDETKNARLLLERNVSFEDVVLAINSSGLLDDIEHPNPTRFMQRIFIVRLGEQAFAVPYMEDDARLFLKTIYPSRKLTRRYLGGEQ